MRVLVLNAGSSSLKVSMVDDDAVASEHEFEVAEGRLDDAELSAAVRSMGVVEAVGHRVVHSGPRYRTSVRIDREVISYLLSITDLAPLHMPAALAGIGAVRELLPRVPGVACFDTAFHRTLPEVAWRFALPRRVLQQTYSTCFGDFALEFYTFLADNYAPFHSMPIECTDRDAAFVLDGLLYNESDMEIEEHYTDTHGYTELNFAAFGMLGRRFCPRIKDVKHQHIYRIDATMDYGQLAHIVGRADCTIDPQTVVDHWDKMGNSMRHWKAGTRLRR